MTSRYADPPRCAETHTHTHTLTQEVGKATDFEELERKKAARQAELEAKRAAAAPKKAAKEPVKALEGKMWKIENQMGTRFDKKTDKLEGVTMQQSVTLDGCENFLLEITGKVNMVILQDCKNVGVMMTSLVSGIEVVKGQKIELQATGKLPSLNIDRCNELMLYTTEESRDVEITSTASVCVNVTITDEAVRAVCLLGKTLRLHRLTHTHPHRVAMPTRLSAASLSSTCRG